MIQYTTTLTIGMPIAPSGSRSTVQYTQGLVHHSELEHFVHLFASTAPWIKLSLLLNVDRLYGSDLQYS
eukprot:m.104106 g.104106  ORF g.104106 m.104106 type:complete len:69 (-) comp20914_c0_seq1:52-258(-)